MNFDAASKKTTLTATFADGTTETRTTANPYTVCATVPCKGYRTGRRPFWSRSVAGATKAAEAAQRLGFVGEIMVSTSVTVGAVSKTAAVVVEATHAVDIARIVAKVRAFCDGITPDAAMLAKLNAQIGGNAASLRAIESVIVHTA